MIHYTEISMITGCNLNIKMYDILYLLDIHRNIPDFDFKSCRTKIIPYLIRKGCKVRYYDPSGPKSNFKNNNIKYCPSTKDACVGADLLIVHTEWNEFKQLRFNRLKNKKKLKIYDL